MPCYHPITVYRSREGLNKSGKWPIEFSVTKGYKDLRLEIPCGQCIGCRLERSRQWAVRCVHEASLFEDNCFVTLTYAPSHLPSYGSLDVSHVQRFMKRLRKYIHPKKVRFFHCGEYGDENARPHYHVLLFGFDFHDRVYFKTHNGFKYYKSETAERLWKKGGVILGDLSFESAAYTARYITKKFMGKKEDVKNWYGNLKAEYVTMSRRPGIGKEWFKEYKNDITIDGKIVIRNGVMCQSPKYYDNLFREIDKKGFGKIRNERRKKIREENADPKRMAAKEKHKELTINSLNRGYEKE